MKYEMVPSLINNQENISGTAVSSHPSDRCCLVVQLCLVLLSPMDWSPPGFSAHGIFQARIVELGVISYSRDQTRVSCVTCIGRWILYHWATWEAHPSNWQHLKTLVIPREGKLLDLLLTRSIKWYSRSRVQFGNNWSNWRSGIFS